MKDPVPFDVDTIEDGDRLRVVVRGELDLLAAPHLRTSLLEATQHDRADLALDLSAVTFIDSTGISVLLQAWQRVTERGGRLALVAASRPVSRVIETAGLAELLALKP